MLEAGGCIPCRRNPAATLLVCTVNVSTRKQSQLYFLAERHQTAAKRFNFRQSYLRNNNCEYVYDYVFPLRNARIW